MNVSLQSSLAPPRIVNNTYRSITWSVPPSADCTIVVPKLSLSDAASLCLLNLPDKDNEEGPGSEDDCTTGVPGIEDTGES